MYTVATLKSMGTRMSEVDLAAIIAGLEATGMSRTEIATEAKLSRNTVWRMAQGEVRDPNYSTVMRIKNLSDRRTVRHAEQKRA